MAVDTAFEYGLARFIDFRDGAECERVRRIPRAGLTRHPNPDFRMRVIDDAGEFYRAFADDLVALGDEARERAAAEDLQVVRMRSDRQHPHRARASRSS